MPICEKHNEEKVIWAGKRKCKSCNREYQTKWFSDNKDTQQARITANSQRVRKEAYTWIRDYCLTHPCIDCGETDWVVLEFDHRDRATKLFAVSEMIQRQYSLSKIIEEIAKCDVRCASCHRRRTAVQMGWYSYLD